MLRTPAPLIGALDLIRMADAGSTVEIAKQIADGTIYAQWWFYVVWLVVTALGAALGVWLRERVRGDVTKEIWLAQESWKEKYRLYTLLIATCEEIAAALWNIVTDTRVLAQMNSAEHSTEADGLRLFPEHQEYLNLESRANERLLSAEVGIELMLNAKAKAAYQKIKTANTRTSHVINKTYRQRIDQRCTAVSEAKVAFIEAAKEDLRI